MSDTGWTPYAPDQEPGVEDRLSSPGAPHVDLSLLPALNALLTEQSVTGAAERLAVSPPAVSRALSKIRKALGDPLLVRAGRGLAPTPRALELRPRVRALLRDAEALLAPPRSTDLATVDRTFTIVADEAYAAVLAPPLLERAALQVPSAHFTFTVQKSHGDTPLRDGTADIEVGVIDEPSGELQIDPLFQDRYVGVARSGHPMLGDEVTASAFAAEQHISVSRKGRMSGPIDVALEKLGLRRHVVAAVADYAEALLMIPLCEFVTAMPRTLAVSAQRYVGVEVFELPVETASIGICQAWHPRHEAEPVHRWLRETVRGVLTPASPLV